MIYIALKMSILGDICEKKTCIFLCYEFLPKVNLYQVIVGQQSGANIVQITLATFL